MNAFSVFNSFMEKGADCPKKDHYDLEFKIRAEEVVVMIQMELWHINEQLGLIYRTKMPSVSWCYLLPCRRPAEWKLCRSRQETAGWERCLEAAGEQEK